MKDKLRKSYVVLLECSRILWKVVVVFAWGVFIVFIVFFSFSMHCGSNNLILIAKSDILVFSTEEEALNLSGRNYMAVVGCEESVRATQYLSRKDRIVYGVQLVDGSYGYISDGDYEIVRNGRDSICRYIERVVAK